MTVYIYHVGDVWTITSTIRNPLADDAIVDTTSVVITVTAPDGTTTTPSVTHVGTGVYRATATLDQAGDWHATTTATGTYQAAEPTTIKVHNVTAGRDNPTA